jgi:DNA-binding transcriptional MerR regulator
MRHHPSGQPTPGAVGRPTPAEHRNHTLFNAYDQRLRSPGAASRNKPRPRLEPNAVCGQVRLQRSPHCLCDLVDRCCVRVPEQGLDDAVGFDELDGVGNVAAQPERFGDRLEVDVDESCSVQYRSQALRVAQRERSRTPRFVGRWQGDVLRDGGAEHGDPLVVQEVLPAYEHQPAAGAQAACDVGEGSCGIAEEHHAEAADGDIKASRCESMRLRVAVLEADVAQTLLSGSLFCPPQQRRGDVHAERLAIFRGTCRRAGCRSGTAADVEDTVSARHGGLTKDEAGEGCAHALEAVFVDQPVVGIGAVPVLGLVLGLVVVRSAPRFHENYPTPSSMLEVKMADPHMTIGELARRTGVAPSALRYYEELGLMPAPVRIAGQRRYPESAVGLVGVILLLRDVGFSLRESKTFLASRSKTFLASRGNAVEGWRRLASRKLTELDEQIAKSQTAKRAITHALRCQHEDIATCPNFTSLVAARLAGRPLEEAHPH